MQKLYAGNITQAMIIVLAVVILAACRKADSLKADSLKADASIERKAVAVTAQDAPAAVWVDSWAASFLSTKVNGVV